MKILTKIIETPKAHLLVIGGLPEDAKGIMASDHEGYTDYSTLYWVCEDGGHNFKIPPGNWQLLGKLDEITKEQAEELVTEYGKQKFHPNWTAKKALLSLIGANCKLKNKYGYGYFGEYRPQYWPDGKDFNSPIELFNAQKRWDKEQTTVFTNPLIFKKID